MKWVELKNYLAPTFMKEIDHVCEIFISKLKINIKFIIFFSLIDLIKELQKDRYNDENIEAYLDLRESIEDRIEEIENFYEINFDQPYAQHFEKGRIKLKKLLMFEPFDINEIQINKGGGYNYYNTIKSNVYEVNPYKNTINTNYNNYYIDNDYSNMDRGDKSNRNKITFSSNKKEKIQFIPMEVKKKTNIHSVEKSNNSKQIKMNKKKKIKNNAYEINPLYKNTIDNYDNSTFYNEYIIGEREEKPNKTKKTIIMPRKEKIQFIPMEVKKKTNAYSVEKYKLII